MDSHVRFSAILGFVLIFGIAFVFASMVIDSGTAGKAVSLALPQAQIRCPQGPPPQITGMYNLGPCKYELTNGIVVNDEASLNCSLGANLHYSGQDSSGFPAVTLIGTGKINGCKITGNFLTGIEIIPSPSGGGNAEVWDTTIDGPKTGILEKPGATGNLYQGNVITHTKIGMDLQGSGGKTKSSTIIQNGVGIRLGVPTYATFTGQTGEVCNTYFTQNFSWCSRPEQGKNHFIQSNLIQENSIGIETMGLETTVEENTINGNQQYGIKAQAIFLGDASIEGNPQFYSAIGAKIRQNIIRNNGDAGIFFPPWSTYYYKMPEKYWHYSEVIENTIEGTCAIPKLSISSGGTGIACAEGQVAGIQIGNDNSIYPGDVGEPILIQKNAMRKNEVGIQALRAQRPSIVENTISENSRNGIHIQSFSYLQYFLSNVIENNGENGVMLEKDSGANWSFYNQIIHNGKNGWLATNKPGGAFRTSCNDFSFNTKNGYYYYGQPTETWDVDPGRIWEFSHNRLIQNGGSGLILENKYVGSDPFDPFTQFTPTPGYQPLTRFFYNHLAQNGEKGISLDGWFGTGFMANNIIGNGMPSTDSGSNQVEDLWDEKAFAKAYNLATAKWEIRAQ
jgi:hypothetical protein